MRTPSAVGLPDLASMLVYLFTAYQKPLDDVVAEVYGSQLADLPLSLLRAVVLTAPRTRRYLPSVYELLEDCERARRRELAAIAYVPCVACRDLNPGWDVVVDPEGHRRLMRCACWRTYQGQLAANGLQWPVLAALPVGREANEA